ncbi:MAG: hypothetical protein KAY24_01920 [Candidatus Eisenbacteria sp.]|nr:hypothetical protein [Candidatus Eisenbacteria bacterium]
MKKSKQLSDPLRRIGDGAAHRTKHSSAESRMKAPEDICPDFPEWPDSWQGAKRDLAYGEGLLGVMIPFVVHLIAKGLTRKTIKNHMDYLWLLGGEIIRDVGLHNEYDVAPLTKLSMPSV